MESMFPEVDFEDNSYRGLFVEAATRLTCSAMEAKLIPEGKSLEETTESILHFFEVAFHRVEEVFEEEFDEYIEEEYLDEEPRNGGSESH